MARGSFGKKGAIGCGGLVLVAALVLFVTPAGKALRDLWGTGALQATMAGVEKRTYEAKSSDENLKSLGTALKIYQESEGQYPDADKWMDQIAPRLVLNDLPKKEAEKKLIRPDLVGQAGQYGYAINDAAAGKYIGDLPKKTILLFDAKATTRNAHGDPKSEGLPGGRAITIEGDLISL